MRFRSSPLRAGRRDAQRGAAAIEFALAMFFLAPLLMGMMQYGYYFYVAMNVLEAQHQGLVAAARTQGVSCAVTASAAQVTARTAAQTAASTAITTYLTNNGLNSVVTLSGTTPDLRHQSAGPDLDDDADRRLSPAAGKSAALGQGFADVRLPALHGANDGGAREQLSRGATGTSSSPRRRRRPR